MKRDNRLFMALLLAGTISAAGPGVQAQTQEAELIKVYFSDPAYFTSLSDNGLWATAKGASESDQAKDGYPYLVNATDGSVTKLWTEEQTMDFIGANDVTNDGKLVVGSYNESAAIYNTESKEWTMLPSAEGLNAKAQMSRTPCSASCLINSMSRASSIRLCNRLCRGSSNDSRACPKK